jgi:hypothetical protein
MTASSLSFRLAILFILAGMTAGIGMAASGDHSIMPAHAHINLLGWVSLFLFGLYYERRPKLNQSRIALVQIAIWSIGTAVLAVAVGAINLGYERAEPVAALSSFVVLAALLLFAVFVFRPAYSSPADLTMSPAE